MYTVKVARILVASPSDLPEERQALQQTIQAWNSTNAERFGVMFEAVLWELHAVPQMGDRPQAIINSQLVDKSDALIGLFWTRLGRHTGEAESGSVEEIERCINQGKPVSLYFSKRPVALESVDAEEYERLRTYKQGVQARGLTDDFESVMELRDKISRHLSWLAQEKFGGAGNEASTRQKDARSLLSEEWDLLRRQYEAEWAVERAAASSSADGGKAILQRLYRDMMAFRKHPDVMADDDATAALDELLVSVRDLIDFRFYLDGGLSWNAFWQTGDEVGSRMQAIEVGA